MIWKWNKLTLQTPRPCNKYHTQAKKDTDTKKPNALMTKQKRDKWQEQLLNKSKEKEVYGQYLSSTQASHAPKKTQQHSQPT